ncbi:MAG: hypothetical protein PUD02_08515, partial [Eggerthellales bacterium]|nr:hypothetical protein [Eggerthellales bacterium]
MSLVTALMLSLFLVPGLAMAVDAGDSEGASNPPATSKTVVDNGDGTYTMSLSVTGQSQSSAEASPVDVIVVLDTSGSMDRETSTYVKSDTGAYGLVQGSYVQLYKKGSRGNYSEIQDGYQGTVYYRSNRTWNGWNYQEYTGDRYTLSESDRLS